MRLAKVALLGAVSLLGVFTAGAAQAQPYRYAPPARVVREGRARRAQPHYRSVLYRGHWVRRPIVVQPAAGFEVPVAGYGYDGYGYGNPYVQAAAPTDPCQAFSAQVKAQLSQIESAVRARVAAGQLDGNALTAMEAARDDLQQDVADLSAKGYVTDADRAHIDRDIDGLHQKFGC